MDTSETHTMEVNGVHQNGVHLSKYLLFCSSEEIN